MKFVLSLVVPLALSCSDRSTIESEKRKVEGTYVMQAKGEFSVADDTLTIRAIKNQRDVYFIERRVGYQRITEAGRQPKETKLEKVTGIWDEKSSQLREQKHGRIYFLSEDGNQLLIGSDAYTRVGNK